MFAASDEQHLSELTAAVHARTRADHVSIRFEDPFPILKPICRSGRLPTRAKFCVGEGIIGWVAHRREVATVADVQKDRRFVPKQGYAFRSLACIPITDGSDRRGVMSLASRTVGGLNADDVSFATLMADCATRALHNQHLEKLTVTDAHTGAFNRRYLDRIMTGDVNIGQTTTSAYLSIDLDHFKRVNDAFGHPAGDQVLQEFVACVQRCVRQQDIVIRDGGEEFALVMPNTEAHAASRVAERIRQTINQTNFFNGKLRQTVSIGIALWAPGATLESVRESADRALYVAKSCGRNQVFRAEDLSLLDMATSVGDIQSVAG